MEKNNLHKNNGGFKIPEEYFDSLENKLSKKIPINYTKQLLSAEKIDSGFKIPKEYFIDFETKISKKTQESPYKNKVISLITKKNILYITGIAATIAILISIAVNTKPELNFNDIQLTDIQVHLEEENIELSTNEMAMLLGDDILFTEMVLEEELIDKDVILEYLSEEDLGDEIIFVE